MKHATLLRTPAVLLIVPALFAAAFAARVLLYGSDCQISVSIH